MADLQSNIEDFFVSSGCCTSDDLLDAFKAYEKLSHDLGEASPLLLKDLLSGVGGKALFRRAGSAKEAETFIWLAQVQRYAEFLVSTNSVAPFEGLSTNLLKEISSLSLEVGNLENISRVLLKYGIVLVYLPQTAGMKTDGVLFRLSCRTPVIGMTLRYDRYDYFWFTLMHELAHLVLHSELFDGPHFDCIEDAEDEGTLVELEANQLAKDSFVSRSEWRTASVRRFHSDGELMKCAEKLSVHPAILAGMVRYETRNYALFNRVVHQVSVREVVYPDA